MIHILAQIWFFSAIFDQTLERKDRLYDGLWLFSFDEDIVILAGVIAQRYPAELAEDKCIKLSLLCHAGVE